MLQPDLRDSPLREMSMGEILDLAFALLRRTLVPVVVVGAVSYSPAILIGLLLPMVGSLASWFGLPLLCASTIWIADRGIRGETITTRGALGAGLRGYLPLALLWPLWVTLRTALFTALIAPGAIFVGVFFAWKQVLLIEGDWSVIGRSAKLSSGSIGKITGVIFVGWIITFLPQMALQVGAFLSADQDDPFASFESFRAVDYLILLATLLVTALTQAYFNNVVTLLYYDRRVKVDALDVETSADRFEAAMAAGDDTDKSAIS